jgi:hypothetical protein
MVSQASQERLATYLNDHLAGSEAARDLAEHCRSRTEGTPLGTFMGWLLHEIESDRSTLLSIMDRLGVEDSRLKRTAGTVMEKVSRLKFEDWGDDDAAYLNRLLELESLTMGVKGKWALWQTLKRVAGTEPRLAETGCDELIERADQQLSELERHRQEDVLPLAFAAR